MAHKHHHHIPEEISRDARYRETVKVTLVGSAVDLLLGVVKIVIGIVGHSQALIADGIHSLSDLATDFIVLYAAKHSSHKADKEHPYGHERIETVATVILGVALIAVAIGIAYHALQRMFHPEQLLQPSFWVLVVAVISVISKELIYHYTMRVARKHNSAMLRANAWHSRSDAVSSIIVVVGVIGTMAGLPYLDALAAIGVAFMIAKIGWELGWSSLQELVDTGLEQHRVDAIRQIILGTAGVCSLHMLRTRMMGGMALVDVHVQVDPDLTVSEGHHISETVRRQLIQEIPEVSDVMVHIDTEDDQTAAATLNLPQRDEVLQWLNNAFADIPGSRRIDKIVLHYINGKIDTEIFLPLDVLSTDTTAYSLKQQFSNAIKNDQRFGKVRVYFA
ncbi:MAG TPA: cation transporter [Acidiferrobacteraceae bacterium]|nr:cation transporter [Acidiferrobacteraceae bacterium]HEX20403.1 cation transporter [Acidiferrobacteraceae bacterium]